MGLKIPKNLPQPMFVRPTDYVSLPGADYVVKRNEFGQAIKLVGRIVRKLPTDKDVIQALKDHRIVGYWGNKFFVLERVDDEIVDSILETIWEFDKRRGVPPPDRSVLEDRIYEF
ncbi:MAG: hypothetical protein ACK4OO_08185 [bacterium]